MEVTEKIRHQNGQDFRKIEKANVGDVVWKTMYDPNVGRSWLEGPWFVVEIVHRGKLSEHAKLFSTHDKKEESARYDSLYAPIIDEISPPRGHNV